MQNAHHLANQPEVVFARTGCKEGARLRAHRGDQAMQSNVERVLTQAIRRITVVAHVVEKKVEVIKSLIHVPKRIFGIPDPDSFDIIETVNHA